ncbi:MAG: efflux RND transporter permease subunit, partial [Cyanobacteria bacterium]|nr:efflux RND transporter permease subunit [Cyanobacteriota bacterium]
VSGKAAEEMERMVTIPLEKELNGIPRAQTPRSISIFGLSVITVVFEDGVDPYTARQQVLEKISQAALPEGVHPGLDPNASPVGEIFRYTVESKKWNAMDRKEWQDWVLDRKIKSVPGVVDVTGFGGPVKTYQVELDPDHMKALGITQEEVTNAIASANGSTGGSYIVRNNQDFMVRGMGLLGSVDDINNIVVATAEDGIPVLLKDVSDVKIAAAVRKGQVGMNEDDDVVEGIILMRRGENPSTAVDGLMKVWPDIAATLPAGMKLVPLYDRTALARRTMVTIGHNVAEGIFLVVVMLMLFLFQVRSAIICATVIPLALSVAFILLDVVGVPANLLSLGAIDFGIIVDGAIVMVENTLRHVSHLSGKSSKELILAATNRAAREVAKPILFSKAIIVMTFLPILTFESVEGKLFRPLAITMSFTLIGAAICALTIIPVLCAMIFSHRPPKERVSPISKVASAIYWPVLQWLMNNKVIVCLIASVAVFGSLMLTPMLGGEFIPELEEGNIWLRVTTIPTSVSLDHQVSIAREIRKVLRSYPIVTNVVSQIGSSDDGTDPNNYSSIEFFVDLKPQEAWPKSVASKQEVIGKMDAELRNKLPGLQFNFSQYIKDNMDETISGVKGEFAIKIYGKDLQKLDALGNQCVKIVQHVPGMVDVACDHLLGQPQLMISIDRERAARYGINTKDILDVVETSVGGKTVTQLIEGERLFDVILRYKASYRADTGELNNI